jgi:hypothetical protein
MAILTILPLFWQKKIIITLVFKKDNFCRKLAKIAKIVIIILTPGLHLRVQRGFASLDPRGGRFYRQRGRLQHGLRTQPWPELPRPRKFKTESYKIERSVS